MPQKTPKKAWVDISSNEEPDVGTPDRRSNVIHTLEAFLLCPEPGHPNGILDPTGGQDTHSGNHTGENESNHSPASFRAPVRPIPCDPWEMEHPCDCLHRGSPWLDFNLFTDEVVIRVIERNDPWLRERPRTTREVWTTLFPSCTRYRLTDIEIMRVLDRRLSGLGLKPSGHLAPNCTWTAPATS